MLALFSRIIGQPATIAERREYLHAGEGGFGGQLDADEITFRLMMPRLIFD